MMRNYYSYNPALQLSLQIYSVLYKNGVIQVKMAFQYGQLPDFIILFLKPFGGVKRLSITV